MEKASEHNRRKFLVGTAAVALTASCWRDNARAAADDDGESVHGMLIVGQQTVFLSHLPIFGAPHDYQVIVEAAFARPGSDPQTDYFNDRKRTQSKIYTLEPEPFVLSRLASSPPLRSFKANVYRGHFERFPTRRAKEAARIGQNVDVNVTRVIHFRKFEPTAAKPNHLEYLLFGTGDEFYMAHLITRPPDFDHVLSVKVLDPQAAAGELRQGVPVAFPGSSNSASKRLSGAAPVGGQIAGASRTAPVTLRVQPGTELYLEEAELAS